MKKWGECGGSVEEAGGVECGGSRRGGLHDSSVELIDRRGSSDVVNNKGGATAR